MNYISPLEIEHFGVLGQKWGVRRYQNSDGTLTAKGLARQKKRDDKVGKIERLNMAEDYVRSTKASQAIQKTIDYNEKKARKTKNEEKRNRILSNNEFNKTYKDSFDKVANTLLSDLSEKEIRSAKRRVSQVMYDQKRRKVSEVSYIVY